MEQKERIEELVRLMKEDLDNNFPPFYELTKKSIFLNIYSYVHDHATSEDILQDTYVKFLDNLDKIKPKESPLGLLYVISKNLALTYIKKKEREVSLDNFSDSDSFFKDDEDEQNPEYFVYIRKLLSEKEYKILILYIVEDYTHKEIAKELKIPIGTVTWSYNNALKKIRKEEAKHETRT